jgi:O-antigen ligase
MKPSWAISLAGFLDRVIFGSLLVTIALTAIPYGTVEPWWTALFESVVFAIALLAVFEALLGGTWHVRGWSLLAPLIVLTAFAVFQSLRFFSGTGPTVARTALSADPYTTRLFATKLFALIVAGALLQRYASDRRRLRALVYTIIVVGVATAIFGLVRKSMQQSPGFVLPYLMNDNRGFAQFINRNHFAFLMALALGPALGLILGEAGLHRRVLVLLPASALLWVALIYSNSRGGIIASLGELLFLGVFLDPVRHLTKVPARTAWQRFQNLAGGFALRGLLIACLIGLFAYGVGWVGGEPVVSNFQLAETAFSQQGTYAHQNTSRKDIWSATWRLIKAHPLAGAGFGGYWIGITKYHDATGEFTPQEAHNDYLELLASGGLIGAVLVLWFIVAFVRMASRRLRSPDPFSRAASLGALTGIFGIAIHSFTDFGLHVTINALVLTALIVIAVHNPLDDKT